MSARVFVGTAKGAFLLTSDHSRQDWTIEGPLFPGWKVTSATRTPRGTFLAGTGSFVYGATLHQSDDLKNWKQIEGGPSYSKESGRAIKEIWTIDATEERTLVGVDEAGLFLGDAEAKSWKPLGGLNDHPTREAWQPGFGGLCAHSIVRDPNNTERLWCGISAVGVFRSDDGGESWRPKNVGIPVILEDKVHKEVGFCVHGLAIDPDDGNMLYRQDHLGMFRSRDAGDTWERNEEGLPSGFGFPIALDRTTRHLFAVPLKSDEYRFPADGHFRVYRSRDRGDTWEPLANGLPSEHCYAGVLRGALAVDHLDPCGVYVGTTSGSVHLSGDGGDSWRTLPCTLPRILCVEAFAD
ncbi:BNR/Asp-box repeat protein [Planctomycetes bacterium Pan216]|uniref:BNR/Asp-box repeat protein n=1 Tax=Kolteria novifilia TaxID=2527975 RepID=A0A518B6K1_9BACT|nr:BNR/Asp-box repeat protein [Planctomycetes bacterium Pan216]